MKSNSARQTQKIAEDFAKKIPQKREQAFIIALRGYLGGGKTTFAQGLAKGLGIKEKINSPTFNICKRYKNFYHFDCYRIENSKEILDLGFKEIAENPNNIVAIEWAERIKDILPKNTHWIDFKFLEKEKRTIDFL